MGYLKDIANQSKIQTFPSSTYEIAGTVPLVQCSKALYEGDNAATLAPPDNSLTDPGAFPGAGLVGKKCTIISSVPNEPGTFDIVWEDTNTIEFLQQVNQLASVVYYIHDGGGLMETRNLKSFADYITAQGFAYCIKGGKLYTNLPTANMNLACRIAFAPLT